MECVCGTEGWKVKRITAGSHVNPEYWHLLSDELHFCPNPECDVVYFDGRVTFTVKEVKTKVFFKEKGSPKPLCYCKQVTEEDVIEAIKRGARSVKEVEEMTGIGNGGHCLTTNPSGRCCRPFYVRFIEEHIESNATPAEQAEDGKGLNKASGRDEQSEEDTSQEEGVGVTEIPDCCKVD